MRPARQLALGLVFMVSLPALGQTEERFLAKGNTVLDSKTVLMWTQEGRADIEWDEAQRYCRSLELSGYRDWRLPTIEELETLYYQAGHIPCRRWRSGSETGWKHCKLSEHFRVSEPRFFSSNTFVDDRGYMMAQTVNFEEEAERRQPMCVSRRGKGCGFTGLSALCVRG